MPGIKNYGYLTIGYFKANKMHGEILQIFGNGSKLTTYFDQGMQEGVGHWTSFKGWNYNKDPAGNSVGLCYKMCV